MKTQFAIRPVVAGIHTVVATNQGWLGLRDNRRHPTELLVSHKGLYDKLKELDQLLEVDIEYNEGEFIEVSSVVLEAEGSIANTPTEVGSEKEPEAVEETTPEPEAVEETTPEPDTLTPLEELVEYSEEILSKYPKKELMDFVKANDLGKPTSGKAAIEILLELQG